MSLATLPLVQTEDPGALRLSSPDAVLQWLGAMEARTVCGYAHQPSKCPLAHFLQVHNIAQGHFVSVTVGIARYEIDDRDYPMPPWAKEFVREVDHLSTRLRRAAITAGDACQILKRLAALDDPNEEEGS